MYDNMLIHIGYPRTGSTWMQLNFFNQHPQLQNLGRSSMQMHYDDSLHSNSVSGPQLYDLIWRGINHNDAYTFKEKNYYKSIEKELESKIDKDKTSIITQEMFTWSMYGRTDLQTRAERLREVFPGNVKILMITREQSSFLRSLYQISLKGLGVRRSLEEFCQWWIQWPELGHASSLRYDAVARTYAELFGKKNVLTLPYELFKLRPEEYLARISNFAGIDPKFRPDMSDVNESGSLESSWIQRQLNDKNRHFFGSDYFSLPIAETWTDKMRPDCAEINSSIKQEIALSGFVWNNSQQVLDQNRSILPQNYKNLFYVKPETLQLIKHYYSHSNREMAKMTQINFNELGYA